MCKSDGLTDGTVFVLDEWTWHDSFYSLVAVVEGTTWRTVACLDVSFGTDVAVSWIDEATRVRWEGRVGLLLGPKIAALNAENAEIDMPALNVDWDCEDEALRAYWRRSEINGYIDGQGIVRYVDK